MCIFIIMSNLSKLTDKEKKIVKIIVNNFSLESLKEEIELFIIDGESPESISNLFKLMSLTKYNKYGIQYVNYCCENYLELKQNIFDAPIDRTNDYEIILNTTETEIVYKSHMLTIECPTFLLKRRLKYVKDTFWEYDPDSSVQNYGESDIIDERFDKPKDLGPSLDNVIN